MSPGLTGRAHLGSPMTNWTVARARRARRWRSTATDTGGSLGKQSGEKGGPAPQPATPPSCLGLHLHRADHRVRAWCLLTWWSASAELRALFVGLSVGEGGKGEGQLKWRDGGESMHGSRSLFLLRIGERSAGCQLAVGDGYRGDRRPHTPTRGRFGSF